MANYEDTKYSINASNLTGIQGVNTGIIVPWSSTSLPSGFLECNGQSVSTTTYAALFAVVAYTYGGSGASFLLPDLQDRTALSRSNNKALASVGGANTVVSTGNVVGSSNSTAITTAQMPSHTHTAGGTNTRGTYCGGSRYAMSVWNNYPTGSTGCGSGHSHNLSATLSGDAKSVLQPYLTLMYIIKT
jgi:microcystin-dependent protein